MAREPAATRSTRKKTPAWVKDMRSSLKTQCGSGWRITELSERIFLTVQFDDGQRSTVQTNLPWAKTSQAELVKVCASIKQRMVEQHLGLKDAYALITTNETITTDNGQDWPTTVEKFKDHKIGSGEISERTWARNYKFVMEKVLIEMGRKQRPSTARELFQKLVKNHGGEGGSTGRRLRMQYTKQLLTYAVDKLGADPRWTPPVDLRPFIGIKGAGHETTTYISDDQICRLLRVVKERNEEWFRAIAIVACFGLRGVELNYLEAKGELMHCTYAKRTARKPKGTKPRDIPGLSPEGWPGLAEDMLAVYAERGKNCLPESCRSDRAGDRLHQYLERLPIWQQLVEEVAALPTTGDTGNDLKPYSLRHAYSARCEELGIPDRRAAVYMGHSLQTHHSHYSGTRADDIARDLERIKARNLTTVS